MSEEKKYPKNQDVFDKEWLRAKASEDEGDDEGGEDGGGWSSGEPIVDPSIFGLTNYHFLELLRAEEAKFSKGWVPYTKDPNRPKNSGMGEGPPAHPLLSESQQFSGIDTRYTPDPGESEPGREMYNELRPSLTPSPAPQHTATPGMSAPVPKPGYG